MPWSDRFDDPIPVKGRNLLTLECAAKYIKKLSNAEQETVYWQDAIEALIMAAEGAGPLMHARVGMLRALNIYVERVVNPSRKESHWDKRKLARDH